MPTSALLAASLMLASQPTLVAMRVADGRLIKRSGPLAVPTRPGSTVKPFTLAALLQEPGFDPAKRIACPGRLNIAGRAFDCSHGAVMPAANAVEALAFSCNRYFHHWSQLLTAASLMGTFAAFGLKTLQPASAPQLAMLALGEWGLEMTPEELAQAYCRLAQREAEPLLAPVFAGLREACTRGTARQAGREFAGKTGTAATASRLSLQAWFAGFTPPTRPEKVVVVHLPQGRGGVDAAPLARKALA